MIPKELDDLIKEYLTDGIISAKERQVLLKKAQLLGLDVDEIDLYIDAQQQKADQAVDAVASKRRGKTCPFCGAPIPQLAEKCPECGNHITVEASQELQDIFKELEDALVSFKSGKEQKQNRAKVERYSRKARMYYGNNPKVQQLLAEIEREATKTERINSVHTILKNFWTWAILCFISAAILFVSAFCYEDNRSTKIHQFDSEIEDICEKYGVSEYWFEKSNILSEDEKQEIMTKIKKNKASSSDEAKLRFSEKLESVPDSDFTKVRKLNEEIHLMYEKKYIPNILLIIMLVFIGAGVFLSVVALKKSKKNYY